MSVGPPATQRVHGTLRARHYSRRTEKAYLGWIRRFITFNGGRNPGDLAASEISRFLTMLAVQGQVSASTQNQAFSALLFLYRDTLGVELVGLDETVRAKRPVRLPQVLSTAEVQAVLGRLRGTMLTMATLMYGSGLRLLECARLRVKDIDFARGEIAVRDGKGLLHTWTQTMRFHPHVHCIVTGGGLSRLLAQARSRLGPPATPEPIVSTTEDSGALSETHRA